MRTALALALFLVVVTPVEAANRARVSAKQLATALNKADNQSVPYRQGMLSASDIRQVRCIGPDEEPTEFNCTWQQRTKSGWANRQTWMAVDGRGWKVID
jgi:hypothetical protein